MIVSYIQSPLPATTWALDIHSGYRPEACPVGSIPRPALSRSRRRSFCAISEDAIRGAIGPATRLKPSICWLEIELPLDGLDEAGSAGIRQRF